MPPTQTSASAPQAPATRVTPDAPISTTPNDRAASPVADWRHVVSRYERPDPWRAVTQLATTILPLIVVFVLMYQALDLSYWVTLAFVPLAAGLPCAIHHQHDARTARSFHGRAPNDFIGVCTGIVTLRQSRKCVVSTRAPR